MITRPGCYDGILEKLQTQRRLIFLSLETSKLVAAFFKNFSPLSKTENFFPSSHQTTFERGSVTFAFAREGTQTLTVYCITIRSCKLVVIFMRIPE